MTPSDLDNADPINPSDPQNVVWLKNLQGNILSGHGRDHTVHLFVRLPPAFAEARAVVHELAEFVTSAHKQEIERQQFRDFGLPGGMFGTLLLAASGYRKLGHQEAELQAAFDESGTLPRETHSSFLNGMAMTAQFDLGDPPSSTWDKGFDQGDLDLMLLLADDDEGFLARQARTIVDRFDGRCEIARVERGTALRNEIGEGIEHFGYVDGRSQPLFLTTDFRGLDTGGTIGLNTEEKDGGRVNVWNPFAPLNLVLKADPLTQQADCFGSYFVFRKLEQNVRDFLVAEQKLADELGLKDEERKRAGAMVVGRFRDGTPIILSHTDGIVPPKENNFRYDARGGAETGDDQGLKCPFQAHIRKTNPRGDILDEAAERSHRIVRRGITYGDRSKHPTAFQALDDLPSRNVGLLFMCYQASIRKQFAFMQRGWANNQGFRRPSTGIDPVIGQIDADNSVGPLQNKIAQLWHVEYGVASNTKEVFFGDFVRMKGGEFFFAPSIPFFKSLE